MWPLLQGRFMKVGRSILIATAFLLALVPAVVLADEYNPGDSATFYSQVLDSAGDPVNDASVNITLWDTDGNIEFGPTAMSYVTGSSGLYEYDFTVPSELGVYVAEVVTANPTGYGSTELHVVAPVSLNFTGNVTAEVDPSSIWGANITPYTDIGTFGGMLADALGGNMILMVLFAMLGLGLTLGFFWKRSGVLAYGAAGVWALLGLQAFVTSSGSNPTDISDTYMGLFWLCIGFVVACSLLPTVMREKPVKGEDIYVDRDIDGSDIGHVTPEKKDNPGGKSPRPSKFNNKGKL